MSKKPPPSSLQDLDDRLKRFRAESLPDRKSAVDNATGTGMGMALTVGTHLVSGLAVGGFIGYLLDRWLNTQPGFMIAFFFLGAASGMVNVYRTAKGHGLAMGYTQPPQPAEQRQKEEGSQSSATDDIRATKQRRE